HLKDSAWQVKWLYPVYKTGHYHSTTHEALVVQGGSARLELGGPRIGETQKVERGDVIIIPAGVGHRALSRSSDFRVFGCYPVGSPPWDMLRGRKKEREQALVNIAKLGAPPPFPVKRPRRKKTLA